MNLLKHVWAWRCVYAKALLSMPIIPFLYCIFRFSEEESREAEWAGDRLDAVVLWVLPSEVGGQCERFMEEAKLVL